MALYCERLGRLDEARVAISSAIELDPESGEYRGIQDRLYAVEDNSSVQDTDDSPPANSR